MSVTCEIKNYDAVKKYLQDMKDVPQKTIDRTMSDMRSRAPQWVAAEVAQVYGVKKAEINRQTIGKVRVDVESGKGVKITYTGRPLTPTHFNMTPKTPGKNTYTLKAEIIKGNKATLGKVKKLTKKQKAALIKNFTNSGTRTSTRSPIMLMHTGNQKAGGINYIPFQRVSIDRKDIEPKKTVSLPQMVSSKRTNENIIKVISDGLEARLDHHMSRYMGD